MLYFIIRICCLYFLFLGGSRGSGDGSDWKNWKNPGIFDDYS